jgi:hypothetical protein
VIETRKVAFLRVTEMDEAVGIHWQAVDLGVVGEAIHRTRGRPTCRSGSHTGCTTRWAGYTVRLELPYSAQP